MFEKNLTLTTTDKDMVQHSFNHKIYDTIFENCRLEKRLDEEEKKILTHNINCYILNIIIVVIHIVNKT